MNIWNCPDSSGKDPCAEKWKAANTITNPCVAIGIPVVSGSAAAAATVDSVAVVATASTWGIPVATGLSWLYRSDPARVAVWAGKAVKIAFNTVKDNCAKLN